MSKESISILDAYYQGFNDKRLKRPYKNPYNKNKDRIKYKAYRNGYND